MEKPESEIVNFRAITKLFIANLLNFNFEVMKCYNLALNKKTYFKNIGFYCLFSMCILQIIFFFVYLVKNIKSLKMLLLSFKFGQNKISFKNEKIMKK